jgi:predicted amidohydrolase YtcJ
MDGALGARGAWLFESYSDLPSSKGLNTVTIEYLTRSAEIAIENGFQLCTHAIGDRGNHETLNIYASVFDKYPDKEDLRWRIEHAQHIHPEDIPRFTQLDVLASMQPNHATSDGPWVPKRLGKQRSEEGAYVWQKLIKAGAIINSGTDAPVEDINTLANFYAAITRRLPDGTRFYPEQCMTREQALKSYTLNNAYAAFEEDMKGSLTPGKLADITVLSKDIMTIPEEEILNTEVLYTIVGGKIMYQHP